MADSNSVRMKIRSEKIEFVRAELSDVNGISRSVILDADYFIKTGSKGIPFVKGLMLHGVKGHLANGSGILKEIGVPSAMMYPDYSTFRVLPWRENTASILMDYNVDNLERQNLRNPRMHCRHQLNELEKLGYNLFSALEYEFYVVKTKTMEPLDQDFNIFTMQKNNRNVHLLYDIMRNLKKVGLTPECMHSEYGPGQFEITVAPKYGIQAADNAFRYKHVVKELSLMHDCTSSFMSKPYKDESGCSGHFNFSVWNTEDKKNAMFDAEKLNKMSEIAAHWIAGLQYHSGALMALCSPTVNCYRRIRPDSFAPINNTWGIDNRTAAFRYKSYSEEQTYVENRIASGAVNPYLVTAAVIIAGMDGIKRELELSEAIRGSAYEFENCPERTKMLPSSLDESLECLKSNKIFCEGLGPDFIKQFTAVKNLEIEQAKEARNNDRLYQWEKDFYFEYL